MSNLKLATPEVRELSGRGAAAPLPPTPRKDYLREILFFTRYSPAPVGSTLRLTVGRSSIRTIGTATRLGAVSGSGVTSIFATPARTLVLVWSRHSVTLLFSGDM